MALRATYFRTIWDHPLYEVKGQTTRNLVSVPNTARATLHCTSCGYRCIPDEKPCHHMAAALKVAMKG